ncbi:nicotinamide mononucleotide transporter [Colwellia sp. MB02u-18]|uniref:nicotinamide riboside transporter PnuC n=1 Tax=unclassified Colwellia TaxID=196834 RepID=UPI0015F546BA|nr:MULTISPECIES: nicotinamide riboside transporter PnuC [unclassified Colwellia]MBA6224857.1 nicotinamide mononucleotide transporter [Colwellia sp. MB3u-45]MBA6268855.1 nicotinamide mononucleotide transporter [Colwellia sp. MB3u-43]MBA6321286.1 nicotinamide mononucleotide transporter [Colwellia sp. MB02u-19]MBA6325839.1 nicotinamide mononucleotide transporter [Colwellia sp. MB02u-18]MBA6332314.1 nicotinamide mononucleotide transporter [Colwellia sp. MB02u-12]
MANAISASSEIVTYFTTLPLLELIAVVASLLYVVLAAKGSIWCWPAAILSTVLYTVIFYDVYLWMDSVLQLYYLLMAVYGWFCWHKNKPSKTHTDSNRLLYSQWTLQRHSRIIVLLTLVSLVLGWVMATYTPAHFPYLDSATTVFAVFATYLITQKVLENWLYFIVIDLVSIYLYVEKGLIPTAALFGSFVILAAYGYWQWRKQYKLQFTQEHNNLCINNSVAG